MKNSEKLNRVSSWILIILSIVSVILSIILNTNGKSGGDWIIVCRQIQVPILSIVAIMAIVRSMNIIIRRGKKLKIYCQCKDCPSPEIKEGQLVFIVDNKFYHTKNICGMRALGGDTDEDLSLSEKEKRAHNVSIKYKDALKLAERDIRFMENKLKFRTHGKINQPCKK